MISVQYPICNALFTPVFQYSVDHSLKYILSQTNKNVWNNLHILCFLMIVSHLISESYDYATFSRLIAFYINCFSTLFSFIHYNRKILSINFHTLLKLCVTQYKYKKRKYFWKLGFLIQELHNYYLFARYRTHSWNRQMQLLNELQSFW